MNKNYIIKWKSFDFSAYIEIGKKRTFSDVQWKEYGVRATDDETREVFVIPYTSIYEIEVIETEV